MAANALPKNPESSDRNTWQTLVRDQRYRLFAAGNRRAVIAECLPIHDGLQRLKSAGPVGPGFDASYGLRANSQNRFVLLTQVSRAFDNARGPVAGPDGSPERRGWRWEASHCIQPIAQLKSYIDEESGNLVFFLTRSTCAKGADAATMRERLEDSALRIGKSLGLDEDNLEALRVASLVHEIGKVTPPTAVMGRFSPAGDAESEEGEPCRFPGCPRPADVTLRSEPYCTEHFIGNCYERLDSCRETLGRRRPSDETADEMRAFLQECAEHAADLTRNPFGQDALERARLLDILHTASDLSRRVRRSPRWEKSYDVRVRCETPGRPWQEDVRTMQISRHGALFECAHLVRPEDWLLVERLDTGRRAKARLAWRGHAKAGHFTLGLEFVESDNFWGLNWADA